MKQASEPTLAEAGVPEDPSGNHSTHTFNLLALGTLFQLTLRQNARGRRVLIFSFLFLMPAILAFFAHMNNPNADVTYLELGIIFYLIPHALLPLIALVYSAGIIQDEVEEQTLTYLLVRPL